MDADPDAIRELTGPLVAPWQNGDMGLLVAIPGRTFLIPDLALLAIGIFLLVCGLYSLKTGRPGIMNVQYFSQDRQTIRTTPVRLLRQAGLGMTLFGIGALIWAAVGFPPSAYGIAGLFMLIGLVLLIVVGVSIPYTRRARLLNALVTALTILALNVLLYVVGPSPFRPR